MHLNSDKKAEEKVAASVCDAIATNNDSPAGPKKEI